MTDLSFKITQARSPEVPIVLSVPHCGTEFPDELASEYKPHLSKSPDDTDWFVDRLYDFVSDLGITMISARYSRWVIDLNRDPHSKPLYSDGRIITALCPSTTFTGESLYTDERKEVTSAEVKRRVELYYEPYHRKISDLIEDRKSKFGKVLLWDCHSIRQFVPTIYALKIPDLILGDADGASAAEDLSSSTLAILDQGKFEVSHNHPFKGGYITRHFGKPSEKQHALQLEMTKVNYMDSAEKHYDLIRANEMRELLKKVFENLIRKLL